MKKFKSIIFLIVILSLVCVSCFRIDKQESNYVPSQTNDIGILPEKKGEYLPPETKNFNGVDYRMSRSAPGKYGGQIVTSTIGEGPKTFNPWTSKDATSSDMSNLMYDGLFSTDVDTGEVIPALAKEMIVSPDQKTYTVKLRKGVKWTDGEEITADDVVYTWNTLIFGGFGNTSTRDAMYIDGKLPTVSKITSLYEDKNSPTCL